MKFYTCRRWNNIQCMRALKQKTDYGEEAGGGVGGGGGGGEEQIQEKENFASAIV